MIIVKMARGITEHFPARASEWALGVVLFNWGIILLSPTPTFESSPAFAALERWASETTWGYACLMMGLLRLFALIINGSFHGFKYSPHIRSLMAFFSGFFWCSISLGLLQANVSTTGLAVYPVLLLLDIYNVYRAAGDAGLQAGAEKYATDVAT